MTATEGRNIGVLLILQMASALIAPFVLMDALIKGYPAFLESAAASAGSIRAGVAVATLGAALTLAIGILMFPRLSEYSRPLALVMLAVCVLSCAVDLVHNATVLSMLGAAEHYSSSAADTAITQAWGMAAASLRRSVHIMQLVAICAWIFTFYISVLRYALIPRSIAVLCILGIAGQFIGVTLMMFLGNSPITYLAIPLAPIHLLAAGWIIAKGLPPPAESL
jgi:hypothetical protein